ncbi:terminase small subunit [Enterobacter kobei]|nr:terminase small subunit [Enterobacter kobei]
MARVDWAERLSRFAAEWKRSGIPPQEWCEREGYLWSTAKAYISIKKAKAFISEGDVQAPKKTPNSEKKSRKQSPKKITNSQSENVSEPAKNTGEKLHEKLTPGIETEIQNDTFAPSDFGLSGQQGEFAEAVSEGKSLIEAYRIADYKSEGKSAYVIASQLLRNPKVSRAIRWLRDRRQKRLALTEAEIIHQLSSIASIDANVFSQIRRVNCRYCWGDDHRYQWRDIEEQLQAERRAEADNKPPPDVSGGVGFVAVTIPNDECPRCHGEGVMETFYADTTQLDGPERWAYLGVEETMNGLKVKIASPEAARKELLAYLKATKGKLPAAAGQPEGGSSEDEYDREWKRLRNEKIQAEIERIRTGDKESNMIVVHNALQLPGAIQPTQEDIDEGDE